LSGEALDRAHLAIADEFAFYMSRDDFFDNLDAMDQSFAENHNTLSNYEKFQFLKKKFDGLRPGSSAPDIALPNVQGDTVRLSDHQGKVVYVDFWGTWCFPCLQEMPHSLELQKAYADKPVEFIYIGLQSGEDQIATWKEFILGEKNLSYAPFLEQMAYPGIHLLAEGQFGNPALKPYMIRAAPTYVLIDADGNLISANAPRPGSEEVKELIDAALLDI
jgi:thiol-disulfide isomerase/thioredoxin